MKPKIDQQTIDDLEFEAIRAMLVDAAHGPSAKERLGDLLPLPSSIEADHALDLSKQLLSIRQEGQAFPRIEFEELSGDIKRLSVEGGILDLEGFIRLLDASRLVNDLLTFFKPFSEEYPDLKALVGQARFTKEIILPIEKVLDKRMKVKDDASPELLKIRQSLKSTRAQINRNFDKVMRRLSKDGYLAETVEAYINDRRVLSVLSNYKRQVPGNVVGNSKTGSFTYIEPRENMALNNEMEMLLDDERNEIRKIFLELTNEMRKQLDLIEIYQDVLTELDFINAKVRIAERMNADRPAISDEMEVELIKAYHPLLLLSNRVAGVETKAQSLYLDKFCRMMVISGPNAGGKSITLKTVGLLQLMVQSGLLVPCDPSSRFAWFHSVLSDIGDNQSIANQLSTYSYRLKRMKYFLEVSNRRSLLLLDEFGTGSDPELGGALAEVFFETLYNRKSFGVITTHYANIKLKAAQLKNTVNASMLFDRTSLEPMFQLSVGQPGSSFTFEVAQINGIPDEIIEEAKTRLDTNKVEMDKLIARLQKEKSEVEQLNQASKEAQESADEAREDYENLVAHYEEKLLKQQQLIEKNNKELSLGKKMGQFIQSYRLRSKNKALLEEVKKYLAIEKSKLVKKKEQSKVKKDVPKPNVKPKRKPKQRSTPEPAKPVELGCIVRIKDSSKKGEVIELKGKEATVLFGNFKTKVKVSELVAL